LDFDESALLLKLSVMLGGLKEAKNIEIADITATYNIIHFTGPDLKI
jgi:hypothetical protein